MYTEREVCVKLAKRLGFEVSGFFDRGDNVERFAWHIEHRKEQINGILFCNTTLTFIDTEEFTVLSQSYTVQVHVLNGEANNQEVAKRIREMPDLQPEAPC